MWGLYRASQVWEGFGGPRTRGARVGFGLRQLRVRNRAGAVQKGSPCALLGGGTRGAPGAGCCGCFLSTQHPGDPSSSWSCQGTQQRARDPWGRAQRPSRDGPGGQGSSSTRSCSLPPRSFVVGSDGYVYEGRGWHWLGAHTRGHNSKGFGVSIIGDYSQKLPSERSLRVVSQDLPRCAVRAGLLRPDYALLGHRQLVPTECPGEALFQQIRSWPHFSGNSGLCLQQPPAGGWFPQPPPHWGSFASWCSPLSWAARAMPIPLCLF